MIKKLRSFFQSLEQRDRNWRDAPYQSLQQTNTNGLFYVRAWVYTIPPAWPSLPNTEWHWQIRAELADQLLASGIRWYWNHQANETLKLLTSENAVLFTTQFREWYEARATQADSPVEAPQLWSLPHGLEGDPTEEMLHSLYEKQNPLGPMAMVVIQDGDEYRVTEDVFVTAEALDDPIICRLLREWAVRLPGE